MNEELMFKLLEEQQKTNELLQTIASSLEQPIIEVIEERFTGTEIKLMKDRAEWLKTIDYSKQ